LNNTIAHALDLQDPLTGDMITNHKAIARRYLTGWFAIDLLATFPVDYIVRGLEVRLLAPSLMLHVTCAVCQAAGGR